MADLTDVLGLRSSITGAEIKTLYEAESGAFDDSYRSQLFLPTGVKTSNYVAYSGDAVECDTTGGSFNVTLPSLGAVKVIDVAGTSYETGFGANSVTILPQGGDTVAGEASLELDVGLTSITFKRVGTDWVVVDLDGAAFRELAWDEITGRPEIEKETIVVYLSDNEFSVVAGTSVEKLTLRYNFTITAVWFETVFQAPTGSGATVRVLNGASNIFTSPDALTVPADSSGIGPLVPDTAYHANGSTLNFDIAQVGATNTGKGYRVTLQGVRS